MFLIKFCILVTRGPFFSHQFDFFARLDSESFHEKSNLRCPRQFVHMYYLILTKPSTSTISVLSDKINKAIDNKDYVIGLFLDFAEALDTVNHNILLKNMTLWNQRKHTPVDS